MAKSTTTTSHPARGRLGLLIRDGGTAEQIERARRDLRNAVAEDRVRRIVDELGPFEPGQAERLAALLVPPAGGGAAA
ncbi:MAG TPA: hypothetical protein VFC00_06155 [Micromonosporaceae bacterium]|nr:hypothetical protein [Micromonosporaceae bacterium]